MFRTRSAGCGFSFLPLRSWFASLRSIELSGLSAKNLAEFAIELSGILGGVLDQVDPLFLFAGKIGLTEQVGGLHDRLERVAEVVSEGAQPGLHGSR
jgi:hypothetical protein